MRRDLRLLLLLGFWLALFAGFAWLTRNPESEALTRARQWPVVGPAAGWLQDQYVPPEQPVQESYELLEPEALTIPGHDSAPLSVGAPMWILPGTVLYAEAKIGSTELRRLQTISLGLRLERRGAWYRVLYRGTEGWAYLPNYDPDRDPPYGESPEPPKPLKPRSPDPEQLAIARGLLGDEARQGRLGPFDLYTNVADPDLLDLLHRVALATESVYRKRYGLEPVGTPAEAIVLYRNEGPYRVLELRSPKISGLHSSGFHGAGLVALFVEGRPQGEVAATLLHELVHLLNRRSLGPALPPWIDEGLADELAHAAIDAEGVPQPSQLSGAPQRISGGVRLFGGYTALATVLRARKQGHLPTLENLVAQDWETFVGGGKIHLHYATSAFFVRYLLESHHAPGFQNFLTGISRGQPPEGATLLQDLGTDWPTLDDEFHKYLQSLKPLVIDPANR